MRGPRFELTMNFKCSFLKYGNFRDMKFLKSRSDLFMVQIWNVFDRRMLFILSVLSNLC